MQAWMVAYPRLTGLTLKGKGWASTADLAALTVLTTLQQLGLEPTFVMGRKSGQITDAIRGKIAPCLPSRSPGVDT